MTNHVEEFTSMCGLNVKIFYNNQNQPIQYLVNNDPLHEQSCEITYENNRIVQKTYAQNPKREWSYSLSYNNRGLIIQCVYGNGYINN